MQDLGKIFLKYQNIKPRGVLAPKFPMGRLRNITGATDGMESLVEGSAVLRGDPAHVHDGLGVVGVDVEDGRVDDAAHVRAVRRRPRVARVGREPDLIVGHDVDRSPEEREKSSVSNMARQLLKVFEAVLCGSLEVLAGQTV